MEVVLSIGLMVCVYPGNHWEWTIREFGMPIHYDSGVHENKHQDAKHDKEITSGRADMYEQLAEKESQRRVVRRMLQIMGLKIQADDNDEEDEDVGVSIPMNNIMK